MLLLSVFSNSFGRTYYSRQSGLWSVSGTWSTVGYGNATNTGTFPQRGDVVFIGDGHNVTMNVNSVTASITVGQGTSGSLIYSNYLTFLMVIAGDLTVNSGATFGYSSNSSRMHNCYVSGNLINNGTIDLYVDANDFVNLTFNSRVNSIVSGTGSWDLNTVTLFKSTLKSYRLEATSNAFELAIRNLVVSYGTYVHNNSGTYNVNPSGGNLTVGPDAVFESRTGTLHLSPGNDYVYLQGELYVTGGTLRIGASRGLQGLRYDQDGSQIPGVTVSSGSLNVYGGISYRSGSSTEPFRFSQSGGSVLLNTGSTGTSGNVFQINNNASSRFVLSAGTITLQKPNTSGTSVADFDFCGSAGLISITGGTLYFGNSSTANGAVFTFNPYSGATMPDTRISGLVARAITLAPMANATANYQFKSLYIELNKIFDNRSASGTGSDTKSMTITGTYDGVRAFYNAGTFTPRTGTVILGGSAAQRIDGTVSTTFYNLTINNSSGCDLGLTTNVSNLLTMSNGIMNTSLAAPIVCLSTGSSTIGSSVSYVNGPMQQQVASASSQTINFPIGKNGAYRPMILAVLHSSAATVTYTSEMFNTSARALSYSLPPSLGWVSDVRNYSITRTAVANLTNARITLSYGSDDFVTDPNNLRVARDNGSSAWLDLGGTGTSAGTGSITSSNFNGFNTFFTLANAVGGVNPLPVEFLSFNALVSKEKTKLDWSTATEYNADYFEVQRSTDGMSFHPIGIVKATGFSNTLRQYFFTDQNPSVGVNYYRLRQVDRDGQFEFSPIRAVQVFKVRMGVYPNPVAGSTLRVNLSNGLTEAISGELYDLTGKLVTHLNHMGFDGADTGFEIAGSLTAGTYLLKITDVNGQIWQEKVIISL